MDKAKCPMLFINSVISWGIEDPKGKHLENVRRIRDDIGQRVKEIAESLEKSNNI